MKKKDLAMRLAILAVLMIVVAVMVFAEIGIATAFDMRFDGLTYMEYVHEFYSIPWHFMLALVLFVIAQVVGSEAVYRAWKSCQKD